MSNVYRSYQGSAGVQPTGNATVSDVLEGKTFSNASGVGLEGTMPDIGAVVETIEPGETYTIPEGYHDGNGTVTANNNTSEAVKIGDGPGQRYTANVSTLIDDWQNATASNFIVQANSVTVSGSGARSLAPSVTYDNTTGNLTVKMWVDGTLYANSISVYYIKLAS